MGGYASFAPGGRASLSMQRGLSQDSSLHSLDAMRSLTSVLSGDGFVAGDAYQDFEDAGKLGEEVWLHRDRGLDIRHALAGLRQSLRSDRCVFLVVQMIFVRLRAYSSLSFRAQWTSSTSKQTRNKEQVHISSSKIYSRPHIQSCRIT